ncbi:MAG: ATP-binding protein [Azoarcus sp.]|jgi:predicted ATPase|nr:ATP-binding protein [Azoarcus sp.]
MLTDVTIEGLRGVGRVELHFAPEQRVYVLFGKNGIGKTKCLEAIYQFLLLTNKDFTQKFSIHAEVKWSLMARMQDTVNGVTFESQRRPVFGRRDSAYKHSCPVVFLGAEHRMSLHKPQRRYASTFGSFGDRQEKYFYEIGQSFTNGGLSSLGMYGDTREWFIERAKSDNPYQKSRDNRGLEIRTVVSMLNAVDPNIDSKYLAIDGEGNVFLKLGKEPQELGALSSGYISLVKLVQAIITGYAAFTNEKQLQNVRGIVLIDEIDAHLHAEWQVKIIPCLKKLLPNTTFYIATHSPLVLKQLKEKEAYLLKRDDDGVVRSQIIRHPNRRLFVDVLQDGLNVNLNALDDDDDQSDLKQHMLSLLQEQKAGAA